MKVHEKPGGIPVWLLAIALGLAIAWLSFEWGKKAVPRRCNRGQTEFLIEKTDGSAQWYPTSHGCAERE